MSLILHVTPISPNCRQVEAVVHHLEIDAEIVVHDLSTGALREKSFLTINPNGRVPALVDGDLALWESRAIMTYLADVAGPSAFYPADPKQRADILRWMFWEALHFNRAVGTVLWETMAKPHFGLGTPDEAAIDSGLEDFHTFAPVLDDRLAGREFIMGDTPSLADFAVASHSGLARSPNARLPVAQYVNIDAWFRRLDGIPAWSRTAPQFAD